MDWQLEGTYLETCNCAAVCPCVFLSDPTEDECTLLAGWHIDRGRDGEVPLDGLNVVLAVHSPGNMVTTKWRVAVYTDDRASEEQHGSLMRIFGGQAGGHPAALASHVGEILGVRSVPIDFSAEDGRITVKVGDFAEADIQQAVGQGGGPITVSGHPLAIAPGFPATVAKSRRLVLNDYDLTWSESDKTAFSSPFSYQG